MRPRDDACELRKLEEACYCERGMWLGQVVPIIARTTFTDSVNRQPNLLLKVTEQSS